MFRSTVSVKQLFFQVSRFPLRSSSCTGSRKELLEDTGMGFLTGWCAFYQPTNQPSRRKHWREHKALTLTSVLASCFLHPPPDSWWKRHCNPLCQLSFTLHGRGCTGWLVGWSLTSLQHKYGHIKDEEAVMSQSPMNITRLGQLCSRKYRQSAWTV